LLDHDHHPPHLAALPLRRLVVCVLLLQHPAQQLRDDEVVYLRRVGVTEVDDGHPPGLGEHLEVEGLRFRVVEDLKPLEPVELPEYPAPASLVTLRALRVRLLHLAYYTALLRSELPRVEAL